MAGYESVRARIEALLRHYGEALHLPGHAVAHAAAIAPALWAAFPPTSELRGSAVFAEVVSFHAMKAAGLPIDQATFRAASLVGRMVMASRRWLLHYQRHLPPALRVASRGPGPGAWFDRMPPGPLVDEARAISAAAGPRLAAMNPRVRAGACVVAASKRLGHLPPPGASRTLAAAGVALATAYNAAVRVGLVGPRQGVKATAGAAVTA